ncbi:putative ribosomal protein L22/L17 superfamily [Helianthus debilis subsp. tardiflorus]
MLNKRTTEVYALGQHISMSAHKARRVIDQIRGRSYEENTYDIRTHALSSMLSHF